jgi:hypothetical protein
MPPAVWRQARCDHLQVWPLGAQLGGELGAARVVDVNHGAGKRIPVKQRAFGLPIGLHRAVIVQVVLGEIGEHCAIDSHAAQALLNNAN